MRSTASDVIAAWDTAVELERVTKVFNQRHGGSILHPTVRKIEALKEVSFRVNRGEFVAYAGPNGAGKSTTFRLACGMLAPQSGSVRVMGQDPMRQRIAIMRRCGVLFGNRSELWWDHPVRASFEWKKTVWQIPDGVYRRTLGEACELLDLNPFMDSFARELSLGQRMRAELGMMLLHAPELILLDEPTLGLDVLAKRRMIDFLKYLNRERRATIVVTSHDMDDLVEMAGRIVLINSGCVAFDGSRQDLMRASGDRRQVRLYLAAERAPALAGARLVSSEAGRHTYEYDASRVSVPELMRDVASIPGVTDVETLRAPIESIIARMYSEWSRAEGKAM